MTSLDPGPTYGGLTPDTNRAPAKIAGMFDAIAGRYDLLNHVLSGGQDLYWRWRAVRRLRLTGQEQVLDLCTGTCDVARTMVKRRLARRVLGIDFSAEMLKVGKRKLRGEGRDRVVPLVRGDAMHLPAATASMDAVTIAFGIRNVQDAAVALDEVARVLKPGGRLAILEFSTPAAAPHPGGLPLVLPQRAAAAGPAGIAARRGVRLSSGIGGELHAARGIRGPAPGGRADALRGRPSDLRRRLSPVSYTHLTLPTKRIV